MNINNEPYYYDGPCSADAPGLARFKYEVGVENAGCFQIDDLAATSCSIYFSICDALEFDNIY